MSVRSKPRHYDWAISASRRSHSAISSPLANLRSRTVNLLDSITGGAADEQEEALARRRADEIKAFTCRACGIPYAGAEALSAHLTLFPDHTKTDGKAFQRMPTRTRSVPLIAANELRGLVEVGSPTRLEDPSAATVLPASPTSAGFTYRSLHFDDSSPSLRRE
ncbi:hypothetical protein CBOM_06420 [Ceraceosorus bombacis]|uniref:C2H2-type domain-containing protein n=1 Tax=Ceraceosorus bombacis TaxID=401625 RepID=A0A0P1BK12_9BASI|nr:hypothetical protein CBOM_06420 [Ceraceosorus bombacis]